jgi:hypothetical protein
VGLCTWVWKAHAHAANAKCLGGSAEYAKNSIRPPLLGSTPLDAVRRMSAGEWGCHICLAWVLVLCLQGAGSNTYCVQMWGSPGLMAPVGFSCPLPRLPLMQKDEHGGRGLTPSPCTSRVIIETDYHTVLNSSRQQRDSVKEIC